MIAHLAGMPLEELVPALTGAAAAVVVARGWLVLRLRRHRGAGR